MNHTDLVVARLNVWALHGFLRKPRNSPMLLKVSHSALLSQYFYLNHIDRKINVANKPAVHC